jgi:hypothetical protein
VSEDPIGFGGGDGNVYRYVGNGSTTSLDFDGLVKTDERWWDNGATDKYNPFAYVAAFGHSVGDRVGDAASSLYYYDSGRAQRRLQEVCVHNGRDPRGHQKLDHFADNLIRNAAAGSIQFTASAGMFVTGAGGGGLAGGAGGNSDDLARAGAPISGVAGTRGLQHSFDRHAAEWFSRHGGTATLAKWQELLETTCRSTKVVDWSTGADKTIGHLARIDGNKWFFVQFFKEGPRAGEVATAFIPNKDQLRAILELLGK